MSGIRAFLLLLSGSYLAGCQSQRPLLIENYVQAQTLVPQYERQYSQHRFTPWVGPPPVATRLPRRPGARGAVLLGHVDLLLEDGKLLSQPAATIIVDKQVVAANGAGDYAIALLPGRHTLRGGGVGFLWSEAPTLQVTAGDSIRVDFRLLQDIRPLID
jgi:hypothetical protein